MNDRLIRRQRLIAMMNLGEARILEIGALDSPTFSPDEADIRFLDWFSGKELRAKHRDNPRRRSDRIVDVNYVVQDKHFGAVVQDRFDLIIANHVLEHVPDVVTWLQQLALITTTHGKVFLSVPDRRFTFDYLRRESDVADIMRAYQLDLERPDFAQLLAALYYYRPVRSPDIRKGTIPDRLNEKRFPLDEAMRRAEKASHTYTDVHCHVFSSSSFQCLWDELRESNLIDWWIADIIDVLPGHNEFHVLLTKNPSEAATRHLPVSMVESRATEAVPAPESTGGIAQPLAPFARLVRGMWLLVRPLLPSRLRHWLFTKAKRQYYRFFPERRC